MNAKAKLPKQLDVFMGISYEVPRACPTGEWKVAAEWVDIPRRLRCQGIDPERIRSARLERTATAIRVTVELASEN